MPDRATVERLLRSDLTSELNRAALADALEELGLPGTARMALASEKGAPMCAVPDLDGLRLWLLFDVYLATASRRPAVATKSDSCANLGYQYYRHGDNATAVECAEEAAALCLAWAPYARAVATVARERAPWEAPI